jgi:hypothetical protein
MDSVELAYRHFCTERFVLPTPAQVTDLERRIGISFPEDYRRYLYLLDFNGGYFSEPAVIGPSDECPQDRLRFMHGLGATHPTAELGQKGDLSLWDDNDPPQIVPIGCTIMGYFILLITHPDDRGCILLRSFDESFFLADGINEFFGLLHQPTDD